MGNVESHAAESSAHRRRTPRDGSFPGSALLDNLACGSVDDAETPRHGRGSTATQGLRSYRVRSNLQKILNQADALCASSPMSDDGDKSRYMDNDGYDHDDMYDDDYDDDDEYEELRHRGRSRRSSLTGGSSPPLPNRSSPANPTAALFARALVSEVTDNPKTMTPAAMADREKKLLKAQERARQMGGNGAVGGMGQPNVLSSLAHALTGERRGSATGSSHRDDSGKASVQPPNSFSENRAQVGMSGDNNSIAAPGKHTVTIGLSLSRRHSTVGHPDTVTRQTAFDFNELQDRQYKYVSSTDSSGWRAGGGERGGPGAEDESHKIAAPDTVHIPIIHIDASSPMEVDAIISALASGEVFIPHMSVLPEALGVSGVSPPDLVIRFGAERNDDLPPDEWPNWCLEFMHNQLYEYFQHMGARWMKRPFSITLAKKVRWKTVKHMNRYFAHAERVIDAWREKGPQYLDPQLAYIEGGATPEEVARPHGIYLLRNGVPTNYFAPNFDPPYTTKMTRSLLLNVLGKSWDRKRREWTSEPVPRLVTPTMLLSTMCGCADNTTSGFIANEVTEKSGPHARRPSRDGGLISSLARKVDNRPMSPIAKAALEENTRRQRRSIVPRLSDMEDDDVDEDDNEEAEAAAVSSPRKPPPNSPMRNSPHGSRHKSSHTNRSNFDDNSVASSVEEEKSHVQSFDVYGESRRASPSSRSRGSRSRSRRSTSRSRSNRRSASRSKSRSRRQRSTSRRKERSSHSRSQHYDPVSPAPQPSVTGTNSTILHMNISDKMSQLNISDRSFLSQDEKKEDDSVDPTADAENKSALACDDDWLDDSQGNPVQTPVSKSNLASNGKKTGSNPVEERQAPNTGSGASLTENRDFSNRSNRKSSISVENGKSKSFSRRNSHHTPGIDTGGSLEYSVGDSTLLGDTSTLGGGSTLLGQHYATDTSVSTRDSRGSRLAKYQQQLRLSQRSEDDGSRSEFSLQESSSSLEVVPTDEELFAVGWAKALDPKSGSYYYFTLDRSKIVWDNPLLPRHDDGGESVDSSLNSAAITT